MQGNLQARILQFGAARFSQFIYKYGYILCAPFPSLETQTVTHLLLVRVEALQDTWRQDTFGATIGVGFCNCRTQKYMGCRN
jgi:hypothetical protein